MYTIQVTRRQDSGTLTFTHGTVRVETPCWWDPKVKIPAKTYTGCSATKMATKKNSAGNPREAIYLPDAQTGRKGIFIHLGTNAAWSDGCIVIAESKLLQIWNAITPKDGRNVTVQVLDALPNYMPSYHPNRCFPA